jgi:hypothetical protein
MVAGDLHRLDALLSDELVYTHSNGAHDTKRSYLDKVRDRTFVYDAIEHPEDQILVRDGLAVVIGKMYANAWLSGESRRLRNAATAVWAREEQQWKLLAFASTPLPDSRATGTTPPDEGNAQP